MQVLSDLWCLVYHGISVLNTIAVSTTMFRKKYSARHRSAPVLPGHARIRAP
jgi:hypothetical protein